MGATAKKQVDISDRELDEILASVEDSLSKANLSKSASALPKGDPNGGLKKDDMPGEKKPDEKEAAPPEAAPAEGQGPEAPPAEAGAGEGAPPAEAGAPAPGEGAPPAEGDMAQEADQPLSDEELQQIYGAMAPEELQRHYMVIRQFLEQHMGQADAAPAPAPEAAPPAAPQMAMKSEDKNQKPATAPAVATENAEVKALKAKIEELEKGLTTAVKAVELVLQPTRKSVAGVEFIKKNEELEGKGNQEDLSGLTKADIDARCRKIGAANLSKNEREAVNAFVLNDVGRDKVLDIIKSKGSK